MAPAPWGMSWGDTPQMMGIWDATLKNYKDPCNLLSTRREENGPPDLSLSICGFCHMEENRMQCLSGVCMDLPNPKTALKGNTA